MTIHEDILAKIKEFPGTIVPLWKFIAYHNGQVMQYDNLSDVPSELLAYAKKTLINEKEIDTASEQNDKIEEELFALIDKRFGHWPQYIIDAIYNEAVDLSGKPSECEGQSDYRLVFYEKMIELDANLLKDALKTCGKY